MVQLYVTDEPTTVDIPNIQLKNFEKLWLSPGQSEKVTMDLCVKDLGVWDRWMSYVVEPGDFISFVGASSVDLRLNMTLSVM